MTDMIAAAGVPLAETMRAPRAIFEFECRDAAGNLKWRERIENLVTTAGKTDIVDKYLKGSAALQRPPPRSRRYWPST